MSESSMVAQASLDREAQLDALEAQVAQALDLAARAGATQAEVSANSSLGLSVTVRLGEVEMLEHMQDRGIAVTVYIGGRKGHASSADLNPGSLAECVERAMDIARFTQEDRANGLAAVDLMATEFPDLDIWHPVSLDAEAAIERALACEQAGRDDARIVNSEGASVNAGHGLGVYGNSNGFIGRSAGTRFGQNCILLAGEGGQMQRDYAYDSRRCLDDLEAPAETGARAAERTVARLNAQRLPTAEMPVLLAPEVARGVIGHLVGAVSGSALYRNASFLRDRVGEELFAPWVNIVENPLLQRAAGSSAFDSEGVATRTAPLVRAGVLERYVLSSYSARRLELQTTANAGGVRNLVFEPGGEGSEDLLAAMDRGLYVTEVMGQGVSLVTGDYSRGASGFLVENGKIVHPVEEVTIAGNLGDMFANIAAAGHDVDTRGNIRCGSVLISTMMIAGT